MQPSCILLRASPSKPRAGLSMASGRMPVGACIPAESKSANLRLGKKKWGVREASSLRVRDSVTVSISKFARASGPGPGGPDTSRRHGPVSLRVYSVSNQVSSLAARDCHRNSPWHVHRTPFRKVSVSPLIKQSNAPQAAGLNPKSVLSGGAKSLTQADSRPVVSVLSGGAKSTRIRLEAC